VRIRNGEAAIVLVTLAAGLVGCSQQPAPRPTDPPETASADPSASPSASSTPAAFTIPTSCGNAVSAERQAAFAAQGLPLLYGPGSPSNAEFDRSPVESDTTDVQCIWGTADLSTSVEIDIGNLAETDRPIVVNQLTAQYLTYEKDGDVDRYFLNGDELLKFNGGLHLPATMNVLRARTWITVSVLPGGPAQLVLAREIADDVETITHAKP